MRLLTGGLLVRVQPEEPAARFAHRGQQPQARFSGGQRLTRSRGDNGTKGTFKGPRQRVSAIRLEQERKLVVLHARGRRRAPRRQEDRQGRLALPDFPRQLQAVDEAGHHQVGDHDVDVVRLHHDSQSSVRAGDMADGKAERGQQLTSQRRHLVVVFDQQHVFASIVARAAISQPSNIAAGLRAD